MNKPQLDLIADVAAKIAVPPVTAPGPDDFDWKDTSVVVPPRPGVAVYQNPNGDVVIRVQATESHWDEDHFVFMQPASVAAVIEALKAYVP